ncbi:MAG TPA: hypothetical protein VFP19_05365, partial [Candidatus Limnocylindrales bacterium]|nr:hypothetical protein [Candidatus Limnocylindrales bacterium]
GVGPITESEAAAYGPIFAVIFGFIVGWIILAALTGWLAGRKNRDGGMWVVLGFFTGPFALIAICLAKPAPKKDRWGWPLESDPKPGDIRRR